MRTVLSTARAVSFCLFGLWLVVLVCSHRSLPAGVTCGSQFNSPETALEIPQPAISWVSYRIITCDAPIFWLKAQVSAVGQKLSFTASVPAISRFDPVRISTLVIGPGLPALPAADQAKVPAAALADIQAQEGAVLFESPEDQSTCAHLKSQETGSDSVVWNGRCNFHEPDGDSRMWVVHDERLVAAAIGEHRFAVFDAGGHTAKVSFACCDWSEDFTTPYPMPEADCPYCGAKASSSQHSSLFFEKDSRADYQGFPAYQNCSADPSAPSPPARCPHETATETSGMSSLAAVRVLIIAAIVAVVAAIVGSLAAWKDCVVKHAIEGSFQSIGRCVGTWPITVAVVSFLIFVAFGRGVALQEGKMYPARPWVSEGAVALGHQVKWPSSTEATFMAAAAVRRVDQEERCSGRFQLERHSEDDHGDVCRAADGNYACPDCCEKWKGAPHCISGSARQSSGQMLALPCRVASCRDWPWEKELVRATPGFYVNGEPKSGTGWCMSVVETLTKICGRIKDCRNVEVSYELKHTIPMVGHNPGFDWSSPPVMSDAEVDVAARRAIDKLRTFWITIVRDPRDVVVSSYRYYKWWFTADKMTGALTFDDFARKHILASAQWVQLRYRFFLSVRRQSQAAGRKPRAFIVFYEKLKRNFAAEVQHMSLYMFGLKLPDDQVKQAAAKLGFKNETRINEGKVLAQKGEACSFLSELRQDTLAYVNKIMHLVWGPDFRRVWVC